tara:strand:- start:4694 stop:4897 length:204 start_codon:yes stop_codon:yes gene_type:complete
MVIRLEDIIDFSILSMALMVSMFIGKINMFLSYITFEAVSDVLSIAIQILVLWGLIHKVKKFKKKDV